MKIYVMVVLCLWMSGCAYLGLGGNSGQERADQINAEMHSWMGHSKADLLKAWGPPTKVDSDGQGGEILTYETTINQGQTAGVAQRQPYTGAVTYTAPQQNSYQRVRQMYVNPLGVLYYQRWQGL